MHTVAFPQIGQQYLTFLLDQRRFEEAASLAPWLLQVSIILMQCRKASWHISNVTAYHRVRGDTTATTAYLWLVADHQRVVG